MEMLSLFGVLLVFVIFILAKTIRIVPQGEEWIVERLGKFHTKLLPGLNFVIPLVDNIQYKTTTKELIQQMDSQEVITKDNAVIIISAVILYKITEPQKAVYSITNFENAVSNLASTTLRSIIGEMELDEALSGRDKIRASVGEKINANMSGWGLTLSTIEVKDIKPSINLQVAMEKQVAAEREKKALIMKAEGEKQASITKAEGLKASMILEAEGKFESSKKEAEAKAELAKGDMEAMKNIASELNKDNVTGNYLLAQRYIDSIKSLSNSNNSKIVFIPSDLKHSLEGIVGINGTILNDLSK